MKNTAFLVFLLFLLQSCNEDTFSTVVTVDLPEHNSQLAIAAHFTSEDSLLQVFVSNSLSVIDTQAYDVITDASIRLLKDGVEVGDFKYSADSRYYESLNNGILDGTSARYELQVETPKYGLASAVQDMPKLPTVNEIVYELDAGIDNFGERTDLFVIKLQDELGQENFYEFRANYVQVGELELEEEVDYFFGPDIYLLPADLTSVAGSGGSIIFTDASFDGKESNIRVNAYSYMSQELEEIHDLYAEIRSTSADRYYYLNSLDKSRQASNNPFEEPVIVHENIENGHGVFTLSNIVRLKVD